MLTSVTLGPAGKCAQKPVDLVVDFTDSIDTVGYLLARALRYLEK
jgi:hypothetical protein